MKIGYVAGIILFAILSVSACKDFIEASLTGRKVEILAPADKYESNQYNVSFWWQADDDALGYRLQIVSPGFDSIKFMVADTLVRTNKLNMLLAPGKYEWRVRMENGSSVSAYSKRSFTIFLSSIKDQQVLLKSPAHNLVTNQQSATYKWESLFGSQKYRLQIDTNNFADESTLVFNNLTPNTEFSIPFSKEKLYQWRVRGESDTIYSKWSFINNVTYDNTAPAKVSLGSPASDQVLASPVSLQWNSTTRASKYQLTVLKSDSVTVYNSTFPLTQSGTSYSFSSANPNEKIYWKVRAIDAAGNVGVYSDLRNFTVQ